MNPWPITPLGTKDLDFAVVNYDFTGLTADHLGPLPPLEGAMDSILNDITTSLADQSVLIASMDGTFDDFSKMLNEVGSDDFDTVLGSLGGSASTGDSLLNDYVTLFTPSGPPSGGGGGGGTPPAKCGRHGQSSIGVFDFHNCDQLLTLPIASVADGPCTSEFALSPAFAQNAPPAIFVSITQTAGDTAVFTFGVRHVRQADGTTQDYWTVTVTPSTPGKYNAQATMVQQRPNLTVRICLTVDVIP